MSRWNGVRGVILKIGLLNHPPSLYTKWRQGYYLTLFTEYAFGWCRKRCVYIRVRMNLAVCLTPNFFFKIYIFVCQFVAKHIASVKNFLLITCVSCFDLTCVLEGENWDVMSWWDDCLRLVGVLIVVLSSGDGIQVCLVDGVDPLEPDHGCEDDSVSAQVWSLTQYCVCVLPN